MSQQSPTSLPYISSTWKKTQLVYICALTRADCPDYQMDYVFRGRLILNRAKQ